MSKEKMSPRQKMIAVMYLVLTALLALNVSKEVLNAFVFVNDGIEESNALIAYKNEKVYQQFNSNQLQSDTLKYKKILPLVIETKEITKEALNYIAFIRKDLQKESGIQTLDDGKILFARLDDTETATRILTYNTAENVNRGEQLRLEIETIYQRYLNIIDKGNQGLKNSAAYIDFKSIYATSLPLQVPNKMDFTLEGKSTTWVDKHFYNMPIIATDVLLNQLQNDIYNTEYEVLNYLQKQIGADIIHFDVLQASVIAPKSYLPQGKMFEASILLAASSSEQKAEVFIGNLDKSKFSKDVYGKLTKTFSTTDDLFFIGKYQLVPQKNGTANFEEITKSVGIHKYEGIIRVVKPTGGFDLYPFQFDYEVAPQSAFSVAPTAMNVLYIGLKNPLSITVSDSKASDVVVKINNGNVTKTEDGWEAEVFNGKSAMIEVYSKKDGELKKVGTQNFRIKQIPIPISTLDGIVYDDKITLNKLKAHKGVVALMQDFVFDVRFDVVSYDFVIKRNADGVQTIKNDGPVFGKEIVKAIENAKSGDLVIFQNIFVKGPDKKNRKMYPIVLTIN